MRKLVIFDIDGTLLDSVTFNVKALNKTLKMLGFAHRVTEEKVKSYLGCTGEDFYAGVLDDTSRQSWQQIRAYNREHNGDMMLRYGQAFDGVQDTFKSLKRQGVKIALYSNCSRAYMDRAMEVVGVKELVDYHECVKDNGIEKPELLKKIMNQFQIEQVVVVGDRIHDYEAAEANRIPCVGVMYGYGGDEMKSCKYKLYNMSSLEQLLKEIG